MGVNELVAAEIATHITGGRQRSFWRTLLLQLGRMRFQLIGGFLVAVLAPALVANRMSLQQTLDIADPSHLGTFVAFLLGYFWFRNLTAFPGTRATAYIVPSFVAAYGLVGAFAFLLHVGYSGVQFTLSLGLCILFFYAVFFLARRSRVTELAVVPVGDFRRLFDLTYVNWRTIPSPEQGRGRLPIVVDLRADLAPEWERFIAESALAGRPVYNTKHVFESLSGRVLVEHLSENTFGSLTPNSIYAAAKRHCDSILAMISLLLLFPFFVVIGLLIRLDSDGPALYRQKRIGHGGRVFTVFKFRTMKADSSDSSISSARSESTQANDPRITRLGRFLRKSRIDELPQILNILRGEMSWIGPRPEAVNLAGLYQSELPFYAYRHLVRPGITGWAQVNQGHVTSVRDADLKLQYDFFYVKNFSFWLDILVVLRTIRVVLTGRGAK